MTLVEIKHVEYATLAVDQQCPPAIDDPFQITWELRQLLFTCQRQGLSMVLNLGRQVPTAAYLPFRTRGQFRTLHRAFGKIVGMFAYTASDCPAIAQGEQGRVVTISRG